MFRECWDKDYADYWKATYAQEVAMPKTKSGRGWKKKGEYMRNFDVRPERASVGEYSRAPRITDEQQAHVDAIAAEGTLKLMAREYDYDNPWSDDPEKEST